ncbi:hypothetical protein RF11_07229 [Thelohanellus kitauei]|uniref:Uncharacterized protein n=1 Tax=Thelohanellus kitauei TaxID=669202 RepID=A0A0C2M7Y0_THEKT|nr:hypothetical protein RF11_07229 [Thelohanellus kitauei]
MDREYPANFHNTPFSRFEFTRALVNDTNVGTATGQPRPWPGLYGCRNAQHQAIDQPIGVEEPQLNWLLTTNHSLTISQHQKARSDVKQATSASKDRRAPSNTEKNNGRIKAGDTVSLNGIR